MKSVAKARQCERDDDLLSRPGLRAGAGLQTPLEQPPIGAREVEADDVRADCEDQDEGPASPVPNLPAGPKIRTPKTRRPTMALLSMRRASFIMCSGRDDNCDELAERRLAIHS